MPSEFGLFVSADVAKCTGCKACEVACFHGHVVTGSGGRPVGKTMGTITVPVTPKLYVTVTETASMPVQCKHCENSPCLAVCKQKAISRVDGQVIVDKKTCIGCKDCLVACPFGAITLLPFFVGGKQALQPSGEGRVAASKCDLCFQDQEGPACVRVCPNQALRLTDVNAERKEKNIAAAEALAVINAGSPERRIL